MPVASATLAFTSADTYFATLDPEFHDAIADIIGFYLLDIPEPLLIGMTDRSLYPHVDDVESLTELSTELTDMAIANVMLPQNHRVVDTMRRLLDGSLGEDCYFTAIPYGPSTIEIFAHGTDRTDFTYP